VIAAVVLAAGGSRRLGRPKQLVRAGGEPLVVRTARSALDAGCEPVVVVVGSGADAVTRSLAALPVRTVTNEDWPEGMSASIRAGIADVGRVPAVRAALILVCDQRRIDAAVLRTLCDAFDEGAGAAVASGYAGTMGVPALFDRSLFDELLELRGDRGARAVLERHRERVRRVPWPEGAEDVDTPGDGPGAPTGADL
jgi:molybdenum cofactor cytidylyltransferase